MNKAGGAEEYREANKRIQKAVKKAKNDWISVHCGTDYPVTQANHAESHLE